MGSLNIQQHLESCERARWPDSVCEVISESNTEALN